MNYSDKLKDPRWQRKRLEILNRDNFSCSECEDASTQLQIHHKKYYGEPWEADNSDLITLCEHCHKCYEMMKRVDFTVMKIVNSGAFKLIKTDAGIIIYDKSFKNTLSILIDSESLNKLNSLLNG